MIEYKIKRKPEGSDMDPSEMFGIECGEGWKNLYQPIIDEISKYNEEHDDTDQIFIEQIKEKFGGLRFYVNHAPDYIHEMINKAEEESYKVCEYCGATENIVHTRGWITTLCTNCLAKLRESKANMVRK